MPRITPAAAQIAPREMPASWPLEKAAAGADVSVAPAGVSVEEVDDSLGSGSVFEGAVMRVVGRVLLVVPVLVVDSVEVEVDEVAEEVEQTFDVSCSSFGILVGLGNMSFPVSGSISNVAVTTPWVPSMAFGLPSHILYASRMSDSRDTVSIQPILAEQNMTWTYHWLLLLSKSLQTLPQSCTASPLRRE